MSNYKIVTDAVKLREFVEFLPELLPHEVYYLCLFGRHKYDPSFPNTRDSGQLSRVIARDKRELLFKIFRLETGIGTYERDGVVASQQCLSTYIALNPRSLVRANKGVLMEMARRFANGELVFNPISVATTEVHRAVDRKFFVDFDFDDVEPATHIAKIKEILPDPSMYKILKTRGGFHLVVVLDKVRPLKSRWYPELAALGQQDVKGPKSLTPVPGCTQGGFTPYFWEEPCPQ